jgi:hypothetical protein
MHGVGNSPAKVGRESDGGCALGLCAHADGVNLADAILELGRRNATTDFEAM